MKPRRSSAADTGQRGSALVVSLLMMAVLMLLGSAFLTVTLTESVIAANEVSGARAFQIAEAGLEHGRLELGGADLDDLLDGDGLLLDDRAIGLGSYSVTVSNNDAGSFPLGEIPADPGGATDDTDGYLVLSSTGSHRNASRTITAVVRQNSLPGSEWALFGHYYLSAHGSGVMTGVVGTNGNMILHATVDGDASAAGTIDNPSYVTGTATEGAPRVKLADVPCPAMEFGLTPMGSGVTFDPIDGDLDISGSSDSMFPGGTYYFNDFNKSGSGEMLIPAGDTVEIYVQGELNITGTGFNNGSHSSKTLRILGCGNNPAMIIAAPEWTIASDNPTWLTVFAPYHPLRLLGNGALNGSLFGKAVFKKSGGPVVYDTDLETAGAGKYEIVPGTWSERSR